MSLGVIRPGTVITLTSLRLIHPRPKPFHSFWRSFSHPASSRHYHDRPFRMAVVGSGPAGFYTSYRVMSLIKNAKVDMYEALPVPFGLVRFGVAPDHPEVKNCEDKFTQVASSPAFTFIGNVTVGHPPAHPGGQFVPLRALLRHYDAVVLAYGASRDRTLGIPGEASLRRIYSARAFVGWYNGLPEFAGLRPDLAHAQAVVVGHGNVALDVARVLLAGVDRLRRTDIAAHALEALARSRVRRVRVVGRRGAAQAAFAVKELRELMRLPGVGFAPVGAGVVPPSAGVGALEARALRRRMDVLARGSGPGWAEQPKHWGLDFCLSPQAFLPGVPDAAAVGATIFQRTALSDAHDPNASVTLLQSGTVTLESPLVFRSIGYKSEPLPEFAALGILFDQRKGIVGTRGGSGRVVATALAGLENGGTQHFPGLYCAGWVKRGPTGVIASTMEDAFDTAEGIARDWQAGEEFLGGPMARRAVGDREERSAGWEGVKSELGGELAKCAVDWEGWLAIDQAERQKGQEEGKTRQKFTAVEEMLELATFKKGA